MLSSPYFSGDSSHNFQEPYLLDDPLVVFYVDSSEDEQSARGSQASRGERGWGFSGK